MHDKHLTLGATAALLAAAGLLGCAADKPPVMVPVTTTSSSFSTSTVTTPPLAPLSRAQIEAIVNSPDRSAADRTNDVRRHPVDMLMFVGAKPGWTALDVFTGGGYTTELLARVIGPTGLVYGQSRPRNPDAAPAKPAAPEGGAMPAAPAAAPRTAADMLADRSAELKAAGFKLVAEGDFLRNPNDLRDQNTPNPPQPKDEFVLKFVKP